MKSKKEIVDNWLPRYTGTPIENFGEYILITNFGNYVEIFAQRTGAEVKGRDRPMPNATADGISIINFGMGSANAATIMDLLSARMPKAVLLLGKCGGLKKKAAIGDLVLPIVASLRRGILRGEVSIEPSAEGADDISTRDCHSSVQNELRAFDTIVAVARPGITARLPSDGDALASRCRGGVHLVRCRWQAMLAASCARLCDRDSPMIMTPARRLAANLFC